MIQEGVKLDYETLAPLLGKQNLILVSKEDRNEVIETIKKWIAVIISTKYDNDPKKMIEENRYVFQFKVVLWLKSPILITK